MILLKKYLSYLALVLIILGVLAISWFHLFDSYELESLDLRYRLRPPAAASDDIVIIEIGEDTIGYLGRFPFDRDYHAVLMRALTDFGARAIVFDIFFSEPHANDKDFEEALKDAGDVYLPTVFELQPTTGPIPTAKGFAGKCLQNFETYAYGTGHINVVPDVDGKYRRVPPYVRYGNAFYPQISVLLACDYLGIAEEDVNLKPGEYLQCGDIRIPLDKDSLMLVNYTGRWGKVYKHYSYVDVLQSYFAAESGAAPILDPALFKDKICVIGLTATGTVDVHPTPFENLYPAVGIHPEIFNSIVTGRFVSRLSREANLAILIVLGLIIAIATMKLRPVRSFVTLLAAIVIFCLGAIILFSVTGIWADMVYPVVVMTLLYLALTLYKYVKEWRQRLVLEHELEIARKIQQSFLPKALPQLPAVDVAATMLTARQVGGDIYDFVEFDDAHLGVMIGDVSGKGIPASLFMTMVAGSFKFLSTPTTAPQDVLANLNNKLVKESSSNLFVTVFYAVYDLQKRTVAFASGGHLPLLHLSPGKPPVFLDVEEGAPLGLMEGNYSGGETTFVSGDIFVYYTDGITEAMNPHGEMYEKERLVEVVEANRGLGAEALAEAIEKDVRRFEPVASQHDDITVIVVKIT